MQPEFQEHLKFAAQNIVGCLAVPTIALEALPAKSSSRLSPILHVGEHGYDVPLDIRTDQLLGMLPGIRKIMDAQDTGVAVEGPEDLRRIEHSASQRVRVGDRYAGHLQYMSGGKQSMMIAEAMKSHRMLSGSFCSEHRLINEVKWL
jgi:hypothetical protein